MTQSSKKRPTLKPEEPSQGDKFIDAARALSCDESEERFGEALRKVARHKPRDEKPENATDAQSEGLKEQK